MRRQKLWAWCQEAALAALVLGWVHSLPAQELKVQAVNPTTPAEAKILNALNEPTTLDFVDTPLQDAITYFKDLHKIEIQLDQKALDEVGIAADIAISRNLTGITLRSALDLILRDLNLVWAIKDEVLLITTPDQAQQWLTVKVYDLSNLLGQDAVTGNALALAITKTICPSGWKEVDGPGSIVHLQAEGLHVLIVAQTESVHQQIEQLLKILLSSKIK